MIPTQWDGPRWSSQLFQNCHGQTDWRVKVSRRIRIWTFTHFCPILALLIIFSANFPISLNLSQKLIPLQKSLNLPPRVLSFSSSLGCPETFLVVPSSILPESLHLPHPNIHIHAHIHPTSQTTHSSFQILLPSYTNTSLNVRR